MGSLLWIWSSLYTAVGQDAKVTLNRGEQGWSLDGYSQDLDMKGTSQKP